jgi:hypothetical protein
MGIGWPALPSAPFGGSPGENEVRLRRLSCRRDFAPRPSSEEKSPARSQAGVHTPRIRAAAGGADVLVQVLRQPIELPAVAVPRTCGTSFLAAGNPDQTRRPTKGLKHSERAGTPWRLAVILGPKGARTACGSDPIVCRRKTSTVLAQWVATREPHANGSLRRRGPSGAWVTREILGSAALSQFSRPERLSRAADAANGCRGAGSGGCSDLGELLGVLELAGVVLAPTSRRL